jgi:hypothetical protein
MKVSIPNTRYEMPRLDISAAAADADRAVALTTKSCPAAVTTPLARAQLWRKAFELNLARRGWHDPLAACRRGNGVCLSIDRVRQGF